MDGAAPGNNHLNIIYDIIYLVGHHSYELMTPHSLAINP